MRELVLSVATDPIGKGRPRASVGAPMVNRSTGEPIRDRRGRIRRSVVMRTPQETKIAETEIRWAFLAAYPRFTPHAGPVELDVVATFAIPPSWPKWKRAAAERGLIPVMSIPDWDNIGKLVSDALGPTKARKGVPGHPGYAFTEDAHVVDGHVRKIYGATPRLLITVRLYDEPTRAELEEVAS